MKYPFGKDYKVWLIILIQTYGSIICLEKLISNVNTILEAGFTGQIFISLFFLLCITALLSSYFIFKGRQIGVFLGKVNFISQIPYIESHQFLFEYFSPLKFKLFLGSRDYGIDFFLGGTGFRIGIKNAIDFWSIGINIFPFVLLYILFLIEDEL